MKAFTYNDLVCLQEMYGADAKLSDIKKRFGYKCPQCNGKGYTTRTVDDWGYNERIIEDVCSLCGGKGHTKDEYQPKMVQDGWEVKK